MKGCKEPSLRKLQHDCFRCQLAEGWSPGPAKRVIRPDDALLSSLLNFSEGEEEEESGTDEEEGGGEGRRRHWQKQCKFDNFRITSFSETKRNM